MPARCQSRSKMSVWSIGVAGTLVSIGSLKGMDTGVRSLCVGVGGQSMGVMGTRVSILGVEGADGVSGGYILGALPLLLSGV